jgi:aminopeptidase N
MLQNKFIFNPCSSDFHGSIVFAATRYIDPHYNPLQSNNNFQVTSHEPTYNITLHTKELNITDDQVTVKDISSSTPKPVNVKNIELDVQNDFLVINLEEELEKDHNYEIYVPFKGVLADGLRGFYKSSYTDDKTKEKKWLGVTQFEAISARKAFPCFDEPAMKAVFEITIGHKGSLSSISNMPLVKTEPM